MLISSRPPFIFLAFNKTGTASIEQALLPLNDRLRRRLLRMRYERLGEPVVFKHARPQHIRDLVGEKTWQKSFTFCFVRNPFDRAVSVYHFHKQRVADRHPLASELGFEQWLLAGGDGSVMRLMSEFISDDEGTQIVDFVGRYENLTDDFARVVDRLGLHGVQLPKKNVTVHNHYSAYYTEVARAEIERRLGADLERFGYSFERP